MTVESVPCVPVASYGIAMLKNTGTLAAFSSLWYVLLSATISLSFWGLGAYEPQINLSLLTPKPELIQVFCDKGDGFKEENSWSYATLKDTQIGARIKIPLLRDCKKLRLDLGSKDSVFTLLSATLKTSFGLKKDILTNIQSGQMNEVHLDNGLSLGSANFVSDGMDPYVVLTGDFSTLTHVESIGKVTKSVCLFLMIVGFFWLVDYLIRSGSVLFTIVLIGVLLRVIFYFNFPMQADQWWAHDEGTYYSYVSELLNKGIVGYFNSPSSIEVAPGIIFYTTSLLRIFDGEIAAVRLFNLIFLSSAIIIFTFGIAKHLFSYRTAVGAALLVAIYPELIAFAPMMLTEYLFITLLMAFIFILLKINHSQVDPHSTKKIYLLVAIGSLAGIMASITRLVFFPIVFLILGYSVYLYWKKTNVKASLALALLVVSVLIGLVPFFYNGYKHSGHYMIATGSGAALWLGSRKDTEGDEPPYRHKSYDTDVITLGKSHLTLEGDRLLKAAALINVTSDPINYAWLGIKKVGRLSVGNNHFWFFPYSTFYQWEHDKTMYDSIEKLFSLFVATVVAVFGFSYAIIHKKSNPHCLLIYMVMLALLVVYLPFLVNQRYGLPIFVMGAIFATYTVIQTWKAKSKYLIVLLTFLSISIDMLIITGV